MPLYHYAPLRLGAGSIIEQGNWGRLLRMHPINPGPVVSFQVAREVLFEKVRLEHFAHTPSRLTSCYVLHTEADAQAYGAANNANGMQVLHEVEVVNPSADEHYGCLAYLDPQLNVPFLDTMTERAMAYWRGDLDPAAQAMELVKASPLRVIRSLA